jgi:hypothetical protein
MPFITTTLRRYINDNNIVVKGALHVGTRGQYIQPIYNEANIHDNNIIWVESDIKKGETNIALGVPNCYTTIIDESNSVCNHKQAPLHCTLECCKDFPQLIISETETKETLTLKEFFENNNYDPKDFNIWNFDTMGSELRIFKGSQELLKYADIIYTGLNSTEITKKSDVKSEIDILMKKYGLTRVETVKYDDNWCYAFYVRC